MEFKVGDVVKLRDDVSRDKALELMHEFSTDRYARKVVLSREPFEIEDIHNSGRGIMGKIGNYIPGQILEHYDLLLEQGEEL